jgi:hypothetical protein
VRNGYHTKMPEKRISVLPQNPLTTHIYFVNFISPL